MIPGNTLTNFVRIAALKRLILLMALMAFSTSARADVEDGLLAFNNRIYQIAFKEFQPLASNGNISAQFHLGLMHDYGLGTPKDARAAARWYREAAQQGHAKSQVNLGPARFCPA